MDGAQYIQQRRDLGVPDTQIRQELLAAGWQAVSIDQAFGQLSATTSGWPQQAHVAPSAYASQRGIGKGRLVVAGAISVLAIVAVVIFVWLPGSKHKTPHTNTNTAATSQQSQSDQQENTQAGSPSGTSTNDVTALAAKILEFQNNNNGQLPGEIAAVDTYTLLFCTVGCDVNAGTTETFDFNVSGVQLMPYSAGLRISNDTDVYVVTGASCNKTKTAPIESTTRSAALLYQVPTRTGGDVTCLDM